MRNFCSKNARALPSRRAVVDIGATLSKGEAKKPQLQLNNAVSQYDVQIGYQQGSATIALTITSRGQATFRKDVLRHLGVKPGEKIELVLLPNGRVVIKAVRPVFATDGFVGLLAGRTKMVATIVEINEAAAQGWAGK